MTEGKSVSNEIANLLDRRPFTPFVIVMSSGERYTISGCHQVAVGKDVLVVLPPNSASVHLRSQSVRLIEELEAEPLP